MNSEVSTRIEYVIKILNSVSVSGKNNLVNLSGGISILEDVLRKLNENQEDQ